MPLEIDSPTKNVVNARPHVNHARRGRADQRVATESDFYDQLLRFQTPEAKAPEPSSPTQVNEPLVESKAKTQNAAEGEGEKTRESDQDEAAETESQSSTVAVAPTATDRALEEQTVVYAKKSKEHDHEVRAADDKGNQDSANRDNEAAAVVLKDDTENQQSTARDESMPQTEKVTSKKKGVVATQGDGQDARSRDAKPQSTENLEEPSSATTSVEPVVAIEADEKVSRDPNPTQEIADSGVKEDRVIDLQTHDGDDDSIERSKLRSSDKERTENDTAENLIAKSQATPVATRNAVVETVHRDKSSEQIAAPIVDNNNTPTEPLRSKRRTDRNGARNRGNNDSNREPSDRPLATDRVSNARIDTVSATATREIASARAADPAMVAALNPAAANLAANASTPVTAAVPNASPALATSSATVASTDTRAAQGANRADANMQGSPAVAVSAASPSDSTSTRGAASTAGSTGARLTQYQETKLVQRVMRGMEQLSNGGGQVRLRLHPPELGSLQMSLRIEGNTVFAEMKVETIAARDALMKNLPVLKDRLAEQGMQVQHFDVQADSNFESGNSQGGNFSANSQGSQSGNNSNSDRTNSRYVSELENRLPNQQIDGATESTRRWTRTHGRLDFQA